MTNLLIFYVGSGLCFFAGVGLVLLSIFLSLQTNWLNRLRQMQLVIFVIGCVVIAISSTPLPLWTWAVMVVAGLGWQTGLLMVKPNPSSGEQAMFVGPRKLAAIVTAAIFVAVAINEYQYHILPKVDEAHQSILVLADSITAGTGANDDTVKWPEQVRDEIGVHIDNRALPGAKCSTALKQLRKSKVTSSLAILEIGGNDLLGSTSEERYEADLRMLLTELEQFEIDVVMLELPLPPFRNRYGQIQRMLAAEYEVRLVPKWFLLEILTREGSTIDSIHLTQTGHDRFADGVLRLLGKQ